MYRMNYNNGSSPRDRFDERILSHITEQRNACNQSRDSEGGCGCTAPRNLRLSEESNDCEYNNYNTAEIDYSLAMVYSPYQEWQNLFCIEEGFLAGTIFKELDKPFYGPKCNGGNCYE